MLTFIYATCCCDSPMPDILNQPFNQSINQSMGTNVVYQTSDLRNGTSYYSIRLCDAYLLRKLLSECVSQPQNQTTIASGSFCLHLPNYLQSRAKVCACIQRPFQSLQGVKRGSMEQGWGTGNCPGSLVAQQICSLFQMI